MRLEYSEERYEGNSTLFSFDTWQAWMDATSKPVPRKVAKSAAMRPLQNECVTPEWYGYASFDDAVRIAAKGWLEGTNLVKLLADKIGSILSTMVEQTHYAYDVEGQTLDVTAYLNGEPECWLNPVPVRVKGIGSRLVKIVVNGGGLASRSGEEYQIRGAAVCAMIQVLELNGYACEVWYAKSAKNRHDCKKQHQFLSYAVKIKDYDNALDIDRLAFALAHPAMYRRLLFGHTENATEKHIHSTSEDVSPELRGDIYIALNEGVFSSPEQAAEWARTRIAEIQETKTELSN